MRERWIEERAERVREHGERVEADLSRHPLVTRPGPRRIPRRTDDTRTVEEMIDRHVAAPGLGPDFTVHSPRSTAPAEDRERGSDIVDLRDSAGYADPGTALAGIRSRDRLGEGPASAPKY